MINNQLKWRFDCELSNLINAAPPYDKLRPKYMLAKALISATWIVLIE